MLRKLNSDYLLMLILSATGKTDDAFMINFDNVDAARSCEYDDWKGKIPEHIDYIKAIKMWQETEKELNFELERRSSHHVCFPSTFHYSMGQGNYL